MTPKLLGLPNELLVKVLTLLTMKGLLDARGICRSIHDLIDGTPLLQYKIALGASCLKDNKRCPMDLEKRMELLNRHREAWNTFDVPSRKTVALDRPAVVFEMVQGVYAVVEPAKRTPTGLHTAKMMYIPEENGALSLNDHNWSKLPEGDFYFLHSKICLSNDLVVLITW